MEYRIIIAGTRTFNDYFLLKQEVLRVVKRMKIPRDNATIVSGCAKGADMLGEQFAEEFGLDVKKFPADWDKHGKAAGFIRNKEMARFASENDCKGVLIAFWDGKSCGTKSMIDLAKRYGLKTLVVYI